MRRTIAITIAAASLVVAGCGGSDEPTPPASTPEAAQTAPTQADQPGDLTELASATEKLAEQIADSARTLAADPEADVDGRLADSEERARELSEQAQGEVDARSPDLAPALREANDRLAAAAAELRNVDTPEDLQKAFEEQLNPAIEQLTDAAGTVDGDEAGRQLERARDQLEELGVNIGG